MKTTRVCSTYTLQYTEHHLNHKAGTQRLRTNEIERDIDYSCVQYIYTAAYRTSDESQGGDTEVTYKRNRKRYRLLVCVSYNYTTVYRIST